MLNHTVDAIALYIKVENGQTVEHPVLPNNLMEVFGKIPEGYEPFIRFGANERIVADRFSIVDYTQVTYVKVNDVWTDKFEIRPMTDEEIAAVKAQRFKDLSITLDGFKNYVQEQIARLTDAEAIASLQEYIAKVDAFDLTDVFNEDDLPSPPRLKFDKDGNFISNKNSGSAPDVIG